MSEPLTSHEIEDVLSSIRRLVASELRPAQKQPEKGATVGKLLLTPSLRVVGETDAAPAFAPKVVAAAPALASLPSEAESLPGGAVPEVFFGEAAPLGRFSGEEEYDDAGLEGGNAGESSTVSPGFSHGGPGLRAVTASFSAAQYGLAGEEILRGHGSAEGSDTVIRAAVPEVDWIQGSEAWEDAQSEAFAGETFEGPVADEVASIGIQSHRSDSRADEPLAKAWADRAEAEITARLQQTEGQREAGQEAQAAMEPGDEEAWFDEAVLRELVRDIIREELAGPLGERITRNVRKLVRLEVNRALTARDFE